MKLKKINPFLNYSLRENFPYILMLVFLIVGTFIAPPYMVGKYLENKQQIAQLEEKLRQTRVKQQILNVTQGSSAEDIDEDVTVLQSLLPDSENYFTIIYSLEELSKKTNFQINSYQINLAESTSNKLSIQISGVGDQDSFLEFLKDYNFAGGRLITAESIDFNKGEGGGSSLSLNFYNQKVSSTDDSNVDYQKVLQRLAEIREKVTISLQSDVETTASYPTDSNPF